MKVQRPERDGRQRTRERQKKVEMDSRELDRVRTEEYLCPSSIKLTAREFIMRGNKSWKKLDRRF